jgi:hypothetical protein
MHASSSLSLNGLAACRNVSATKPLAPGTSIVPARTDEWRSTIGIVDFLGAVASDIMIEAPNSENFAQGWPRGMRPAGPSLGRGDA